MRATIACASGSGRWVCQTKECGPTCAHELPPNGAEAVGEWTFGNPPPNPNVASVANRPDQKASMATAARPADVGGDGR